MSASGSTWPRTSSTASGGRRQSAAPAGARDGVGEVEHGGHVGATETNEARRRATAPSSPTVDGHGRRRPARSRRAAGPTSTKAVPVPGADREARRDRPARRAAAPSRAGRRRSRPRRSRAGHRGRRPRPTPPVSAAPRASRRPGRRGRCEPTVVPRLRIAGWATWRSAWRSSGSAACAPRRRARAARAAPARPPARRRVGRRRRRPARSTPLMSTRWPGAASRMLSTGIRLCPPASTLPSWPTSASTATASSTVRGCVVHERCGLHLSDPASSRVREGTAAREVVAPGRRVVGPVRGAGRAPGRVARGAGCPLVEVVDAVAVAVDVVAHGDRGAVGPVAQLRRGDRPGQVVADDRRRWCRARCPSSEKSSVKSSVTLPMPMMMPAAIGTRLIGLPKSTPFSFQIFAPSRPIMP